MARLSACVVCVVKVTSVGVTGTAARTSDTLGAVRGPRLARSLSNFGGREHGPAQCIPDPEPDQRGRMARLSTALWSGDDESTALGQCRVARSRQARHRWRFRHGEPWQAGPWPGCREATASSSTRLRPDTRQASHCAPSRSSARSPATSPSRAGRSPTASVAPPSCARLIRSHWLTSASIGRHRGYASASSSLTLRMPRRSWRWSTPEPRRAATAGQDPAPPATSPAGCGRAKVGGDGLR